MSDSPESPRGAAEQDLYEQNEARLAVIEDVLSDHGLSLEIPRENLLAYLTEVEANSSMATQFAGGIIPMDIDGDTSRRLEFPEDRDIDFERMKRDSNFISMRCVAITRCGFLLGALMEPSFTADDWTEILTREMVAAVVEKALAFNMEAPPAWHGMFNRLELIELLNIAQETEMQVHEAQARTLPIIAEEDGLSLGEVLKQDAADEDDYLEDQSKQLSKFVEEHSDPQALARQILDPEQLETLLQRQQTPGLQ